MPTKPTAPKRRVIVLGGGAAGFFAAIACAEANPDASVLLLERTSRVLGKVKISGGGRCNVTHACFDPARLVTYYPRGGQALRGAFARFQPQDTVDWFQSRGVELKTEPDGRMFPVTDDSQTIIDSLTAAAAKTGVQVRTQVLVQSISRHNGRFSLTLDSNDALQADAVILATGSNPQGWTWAAALGHTIEPPVPSLFTFEISDARIEGLAGLSVEEATLHLEDSSLKQVGPLLITHRGLSGPAVLKLSAWGARFLAEKSYQATLLVNWLGGLTRESAQASLEKMRKTYPLKVVPAVNPFKIPRRLWVRLIQAAGISETLKWTETSNERVRKLAEELTAGRFAIKGKNPFKDEFVTCGGVRLDEVDFRTMESKRCPGLYFAGEVLDVDGVTGGFNFQNAWTTGFLAGSASGPKRS